MPLCGSRACNCAFSAPGSVITGSGQPGDPWTLQTSPAPIANAAARPNPVPFIGYEVLQLDSMRYFTWNGTAWVSTRFGPWIVVTPTYANVTLGTGGSNSGRYRHEGNAIRYRGVMDLGTGGSYTGDVAIILPASLTSPVAASQTQSVGHGVLLDSLTRGYNVEYRMRSTTDRFTAYHTEAGNLGIVNGTNPFTAGVDDQIEWDVVVEVE